MRLGEKIQKLRNENGFSQEQLAEKIQVSRQAISKWELSQSTPDLNYIIQLSELFNVTIDYLVKESNDNAVMEKLSITPRQKYKMAVNKIAGIMMMSVSGISLMLFWIISIFNPCIYMSDNYNGDGTFKAFLLTYNVTSLFYFCWLIGIIGIMLFFLKKYSKRIT